MAQQGLRMIAISEILCEDIHPLPPHLTAEQRALRWSAYKNLADPNVPVIGLYLTTMTAPAS